MMEKIKAIQQLLHRFFSVFLIIIYINKDLNKIDIRFRCADTCDICYRGGEKGVYCGECH